MNIATTTFASYIVTTYQIPQILIIVIFIAAIVGLFIKGLTKDLP